MGKRKPKQESSLERELRLRKKAEQRLGRAMAALVWHMVKQAGVGRRPLEPPDLARLRFEDRENR